MHRGCCRPCVAITGSQRTGYNHGPWLSALCHSCLLESSKSGVMSEYEVPSIFWKNPGRFQTFATVFGKQNSAALPNSFKLMLLSVHFSARGRKSSFYWLIVDMVDISYQPEGPWGEQLKWWKQRVINKLVQWGELMALPLFHHGREETWFIWSVCPAACIWRALQRMRASNPKLLKAKQGHVSNCSIRMSYRSESGRISRRLKTLDTS